MNLLNKNKLIKALENRRDKLADASDRISYYDLSIDTRIAEINRIIAEIEKGEFDAERHERCDNRG